MTTQKKPILMSGIQPSGMLTIGNYIGAIKHWVAMQDTHECYIVFVDLHTITVKQDPAILREHCYDFVALHLACGIDPKKSHVIIQSHVPAISELAWILNCFTYMGELNRMTQFKDKSQKAGKNINVGLFSYPTLMASDILSYQANIVPVGEDQKQHLELTRDVANRFNNQYGDVFTIPEPFIPKAGGRIMGLQNPEKKMSKSDENAGNYIAMLDKPEVILKKFKRSVTDSEREIRFDEENKAGISNLLTIMSTVTNKSISEIEKEFDGKGYGDFKSAVGESVVAFLAPIQEKFSEIRQDYNLMHEYLNQGAEAGNQKAKITLEKVKDVVGFIPTQN